MTTCQKVGKPTFLLLLTISICGLELLLAQAARAQQSTTAPTNAQPRRPRTTFFEQERKHRFGFSGVILVTDPTNPSNSVFINLPPQLVPGAVDTSQPISSPASLTFGLPTDR